MNTQNQGKADISAKKTLFKHNFSFALSLLLSVSGFIFFLFHSGFINNELLVIILSFAIIYPFKSHLNFIKAYFICLTMCFLGWLLIGLGAAIFPFILAIIIGYLLDPFVSKLERFGLPRWISSLALILFAGGIIAFISIFFFPVLIEQADTITKQISQYISDFKEFTNNNSAIPFLSKLGINKEIITEIFQTNFLPRIEQITSTLFDTVLKLFLSFSDIATQIVNIIILPILTFYFLKDFSKLKNKIKEFLSVKNENLIKYFQKFDGILRIYISWQIIASCIVATVGSIIYSIFDVPYGILLACIAGLLNPIPYFGSIFSLLIGGFVVFLVNDGHFAAHFITIICTISGIHFINAYFLEPTIAGNKVGLHPILMILSVFIFNSLFGILGMLIAVPVTAVFMIFLQDFYIYYRDSKSKQVEKQELN